MKLHRRSFFAALAAPLLAMFAPKPKMGRPNHISIVRVIEFWPRDNPVMYFMPPVGEYPWSKGTGSLFNPHENIAAKLPEIHAQTLKALKFFANNRNAQV